MIDTTKYNDMSIFDISSKKYKKINDNSFTWYRKYKNYSSDEDRLIFNLPAQMPTIKLSERSNILKQYDKSRHIAWEGNFNIDKLRLYTKEELDFLTPLKPINVIFKFTKDLYSI